MRYLNLDFQKIFHLSKMKSSQVAMLVIGIAVLIVILVFLGDIELFDGTTQTTSGKKVTYVGLDQQEKPKERKALELKPIVETEASAEELKKLGETAVVPVDFEKDKDGNFILDPKGNRIPSKFVNISKEKAGGKTGILADFVQGEMMPSTITGNLVEWRCYQFNEGDKTVIKALTEPIPTSMPPGGEPQVNEMGEPTEGFYYYKAVNDGSNGSDKNAATIVGGMDQESAEKTVCLSNPDRIWTGGNNSNYPKCGGCKCCVKTPLDTCEPDNGMWSVTDEFGRSKLTSPCCQGEDGYSLPKGYKKCGDPTLNDRLPIDKCIIDCCGILSKDKTKYDSTWYPMSRCACSLWCYHQSVPHFARYGTATGYIYRRPGVQSTFYYGQ